MNEKLKILDDFCFDLAINYPFGYSSSPNVLSVSKSSPDYLIKKVKSKARELGINYRTKKDYIDFFYKGAKMSRYESFINFLKFLNVKFVCSEDKKVCYICKSYNFPHKLLRVIVEKAESLGIKCEYDLPYTHQIKFIF